MLQVRHCDLKLLPLLTPALKVMFAEAYAEMEERTNKRKRVKEWSSTNEVSRGKNSLLKVLQDKS